MVEMIANAIVDQMEEEKILQTEMREHYLYALITTIEKWITIVSILCIGVIFKQVVPVMLFLTFFLSLRKRTGGYHANSFLQCYLGTLIISIGVVHVCPILVNYMYAVYVLLVCSIVAIALIGTVNHPNLAMDCIELQESKKAARYLLGLECMILASAISLEICELFICYMSVAIILCAFLLCLAKILKQEVCLNEKE